MAAPPSWSLHGRGQASLRREDQNAAILFPSAFERNGRERPARRSTRQFERGVSKTPAAEQRIPAVLGRNLRSTCNTHLATEVSDGKRTLLVVRGKVLIEKR